MQGDCVLYPSQPRGGLVGLRGCEAVRLLPWCRPTAAMAPHACRSCCCLRLLLLPVQVIADCVAADPVTYNEGFLGKDNAEYCRWGRGLIGWQRDTAAGCGHVLVSLLFMFVCHAFSLRRWIQGIDTVSAERLVG